MGKIAKSSAAAELMSAAWPKRPNNLASPFRLTFHAFAVFALAVAAVTMHSFPARAQEAPTTAVMDCPDFESPDLVMPPEFVSSGGILRGRIDLIDEMRRLPRTEERVPCRGARVRVFQGEGLPLVPPAKNPVPGYADAIPGPTLRARVGDLVQLTFVNAVNSNRFVDARSLDIEDCAEVGTDGVVYPVGGAPGFGGVRGTPLFNDKFPNCLHASSTANIHFHGTHTNPKGP